MDDKWQCGTCGLRNDPGTAVCYHCGTPRLIPPIPGTRVYDPVLEPEGSEHQPAEPAEPEVPGGGPTTPAASAEDQQRPPRKA